MLEKRPPDRAESIPILTKMVERLIEKRKVVQTWQTSGATIAQPTS